MWHILAKDLIAKVVPKGVVVIMCTVNLFEVEVVPYSIRRKRGS